MEAISIIGIYVNMSRLSGSCFLLSPLLDWTNKDIIVVIFSGCFYWQRRKSYK